MQPQHLAFRRACSAPLAAGLLLTAAVAWGASGPSRFTARANVTTAGVTTATEPITIVVERFASDAERAGLRMAIQQGGTAVQRFLSASPDAGSLQLGEQRAPIKYAYVQRSATGRLITAVTGQPIDFLGAGAPAAKDASGYNPGLVILDIAASGPGSGALVPAAKIRFNAKGGLESEDVSEAAIRLVEVIRK